MRYPLGRIGLWSTPQGEIADSVTRGLLLYPTVDQVADKGTEDWRARITATPERTDISYRHDTPARGSAVALTVTPDVSIFQYRFASADRYEAVDLLMQETENSNVSWSDSTFSYLDPTTAEVTLSTGTKASGPISTSSSALRPPATAPSRKTMPGPARAQSRATPRAATSPSGRARRSRWPSRSP